MCLTDQIHTYSFLVTKQYFPNKYAIIVSNLLSMEAFCIFEEIEGVDMKKQIQEILNRHFPHLSHQQNRGVCIEIMEVIRNRLSHHHQVWEATNGFPGYPPKARDKGLAKGQMVVVRDASDRVHTGT